MAVIDHYSFLAHKPMKIFNCALGLALVATAAAAGTPAS